VLSRITTEVAEHTEFFQLPDLFSVISVISVVCTGLNSPW
jgi:hypothetical protein